ncbi:hypothetical protein PVPAM_140070600 [Plasmodium vivax]|nr:hypothetical protein PVPAM_140070600 [Plasmodium vivax]
MHKMHRKHKKHKKHRKHRKHRKQMPKQDKCAAILLSIRHRVKKKKEKAIERSHSTRSFLICMVQAVSAHLGADARRGEKKK